VTLRGPGGNRKGRAQKKGDAREGMNKGSKKKTTGPSGAKGLGRCGKARGYWFGFKEKGPDQAKKKTGDNGKKSQQENSVTQPCFIQGAFSRGGESRLSGGDQPAGKGPNQ